MKIQDKFIASMRGIALDSINKAQQGHIGMAIGAAPITYSLIGENLKFTRRDAKWMDRDRFVMSAGHGSMAAYSIYHFLGMLTLEDMKKHKQLYSKTPSHPEIDVTDFVDASTGPLGQGVAMGVGMAISQKYLADRFNKKGHKIFDHNVYVLHGDGCLQEGVGLEAIQMAGTMKLDKLILIHDYNNVQIDSMAKEVSNVDWPKFFESQGYSAFVVKDPSTENINKALQDARKAKKPSYVQVHTLIATNTQFENTPKGHHGFLDPESTVAFKKKSGLKSFEPFVYDSDVYAHGKKIISEKEKDYEKWLEKFKAYENLYPNEARQVKNLFSGKLKVDLGNIIFEKTNVATREYFIPILKKLADDFTVLAGSADLAAATNIKFDKSILDGGKNIKYGIREHAMFAINNGINLDSHLRTIDSTFLAFSDYGKGALRLGALMEIPAIHVFTHDSYQVGGDGPTHQPFDQLAMLRAIANGQVIRPCDENEMRLAFQKAFDTKNKQTYIIGCRQPLHSYNVLAKEKDLKAAYPVTEFLPKPDVTLLASGSEVELAVNTAAKLKESGLKVNVISVPLLQELLNDEELIKKLNLQLSPMYVIEASDDNTWFKLSKYNKVDMWQANSYGYSAPGPEVYELKGFNVNNIATRVLKFIS